MARPRCTGVGFALILVAATSARLGAHDFWLDPSDFLVRLGQVVGVTLRVGQEFHGDPLPRDEKLMDRFVVDDAAGQRHVVGQDGGSPAGLLRVSAPGLLVVGYQSRPSANTQTAEAFTQYLKEEGLEAIIAERARRQLSSSEGREVFSRSAKGLLMSGPESGSHGDRRLGFDIELVAEQNPYALRPGQLLSVRLFFRDAPIEGALVVAFSQRRPYHKQAVRTNRDGRVTLRVDESGPWLVKAVHMVPAAVETKVDWASYWASLTFKSP